MRHDLHLARVVGPGRAALERGRRETRRRRHRIVAGIAIALSLVVAAAAAGARAMYRDDGTIESWATGVGLRAAALLIVLMPGRVLFVWIFGS